MSLQMVTLRDPAVGSSAKVLAGFGFNCFSFQAAVDGQTHEVLWSVDGFESGEHRPSHSGIPLLFPFPGRIRGFSYTFEGREYRVEAPDDRNGNAIHGFALNRPWEVVEQTESKVVGRFWASQVDPNILAWWPSDFSLTVSYELQGNHLRGVYTVENVGQGNLPFGLGTHPYFRVPLGPNGSADACKVTVPTAEYWERADMLPTGRKLPADGSFALSHGLPFGEMRFDDVFSTLSFAGGLCTTLIDDPASRRRLRMTFDEGFRECVVYNPPHREAVCFEPYTCAPDYFTLTAHGVDAGLRVLKPGESFTGKIDLSLEAY